MAVLHACEGGAHPVLPTWHPHLQFCTFCGVTNPKQFSMGPMGQSTLCGKHGKRWVKLTQKQKDDIQSQAQAARLQHLGRQAGRQAASSV